MQQEKPILMSTEMVQAILDGRKTMTRREVKGGFDCNAYSDVVLSDDLVNHPQIRTQAYFFDKADPKKRYGIKCPYNIGDLLYVRETWANLAHNNCHDGAEQRGYVVFTASPEGAECEKETEGWRLNPGIHLPKAHSRIWLLVTGIKVERLQDISTLDAISEGIEIIDEEGHYKNYLAPLAFFYHAKNSVFSLWAKINGRQSLNANPFVWAYTFKVLSTNGHP